MPSSFQSSVLVCPGAYGAKPLRGRSQALTFPVEEHVGGAKELKGEMEKALACGTLRVSFYHMKHTDETDEPVSPSGSFTMPTTVLSEKAIKGRALTHSVGYVFSVDLPTREFVD